MTGKLAEDRQVVPGEQLQGAEPRSEATARLLDQISDPLEAAANLMYLLETENENDDEDRTKAREYRRLLAVELARVIAAAQSCLPRAVPPLEPYAPKPCP